MSDKDGIFTHDSLQEGIKLVFYRICDIFQELLCNSAVLSVIVDDLDLWLEKFIKKDFSFEVHDGDPSKLKSCLWADHLAVND